MQTPVTLSFQLKFPTGIRFRISLENMLLASCGRDIKVDFDFLDNLPADMDHFETDRRQKIEAYISAWADLSFSAWDLSSEQS